VPLSAAAQGKNYLLGKRLTAPVTSTVNELTFGNRVWNYGTAKSDTTLQIYAYRHLQVLCKYDRFHVTFRKRPMGIFGDG